ncbi:hypothetical protein R1sor_015733 [Riccia sorocarpa]|uniref:Integrase catalytic domain-containing protein n=1 Tax=Riccia sorocarpa TaxID=122646 RepID=A0ABD3HH01_9MARC
MSKCLMDKLGLGPLLPTRRILRMADGRKKHPEGKLKDIPTLVGGIEFPITYIVVDAKPGTPTDFDLLFGMKWLLQASARTWWKDGIIEIEPPDAPIRLQMNHQDGTPTSLKPEEVRQVYDWHPLQDELEDDYENQIASCCMITTVTHRTPQRPNSLPGTLEYDRWYEIALDEVPTMEHVPCYGGETNIIQEIEETGMYDIYSDEFDSDECESDEEEVWDHAYCLFEVDKHDDNRLLPTIPEKCLCGPEKESNLPVSANLGTCQKSLDMLRLISSSTAPPLPPVSLNVHMDTTIYENPGQESVEGSTRNLDQNDTDGSQQRTSSLLEQDAFDDDELPEADEQPAITASQLKNYFNQDWPDEPVETRPLHLPAMDKLETIDIARSSEIPKIQVKEELRKLESCRFIYPAQECEWASPILVVPKKNTGKIRICVDFKRLNHWTVPDPFPIPFSDLILDKVASSSLFSFMDGFSGYNQIAIAPDDQYKTTFVTDWGTYAYRVMPFGLQNAPATFQRYMLQSFVHLKPFVELYLDDICAHTTVEDHIQALDQRKIHVHTRAKTRNEETAILVEKEEETKDIPFVWTDQCQEAFETLKEKLVTAPILVAPNWNKIFHVSVDTSLLATGAILSQLDDKKREHPIHYVSRQLSKSEIKYSATERECLGMIFAVSKFRHYLLGKRFVFHVDHEALKYIIARPTRSGKLARWMLVLMEFTFTVEYRPGKLHGNVDFLSRLPGEPEELSLETSPKDNFLFIITEVTTEDDWINQFKFFLLTEEFPRGLPRNKISAFIFAAASFRLVNDDLYRVGRDLILRRCVAPEEVFSVVKACHTDPAGGHFNSKASIRKVYDIGYWWPTVTKDVHQFISACDECQRYGKPGQFHRMTLTPIMASQPFQRWAIDFMGPISPKAGYSQHEYILVAVDYVTKWAEVQSTRKNNADTVIRFLEDCIITRYGLPMAIASDNGTHFVNIAMKHVLSSYGITHNLITPYHPQANGQVERINRVLLSTIRKTVERNPKDWDKRLIGAVWAYCTTYKTTTGQSPFQLVYGQEAILPIEFMLPTLRVLTGYSDKPDSTDPDLTIKERIHQLHLLEETRIIALYKQYVAQSRRKAIFDRLCKPLTFQKGDLVLKWNDRVGKFPGKFPTYWYGSYEIEAVFSNGSLQLKTISGHLLASRTNGEKCKLYLPQDVSEARRFTQIPPEMRSAYRVKTR